MSKNKFAYQLFTVVVLSLAILTPPRVQAQEYEEITYDELVNRLNKKHTNLMQKQRSSVLDDIMIHAGVGLITSTLNLDVNGGTGQRQMNGFQLSFGIDLFSPNWAAEGAIRNFGNQYNAMETRSFRELDMKVLYRSPGDMNTPGYRLGLGLGSRYLHYSNYNTDLSQTTPAAIFFAGMDAYMNKNFSMGAELGYRTSMLTSGMDKSSIDLMIRMDTYF